MKKLLQFTGVLLFLLLSKVGKAQTVAGFENISLAPNSFYNGSDFAGGTKSGDFYFRNSYDSSFGGFWSGFSVSNMKDDSTKGFMNQYSAITGGGFNSTNYGVFYGKGNILVEGDAKGKPVNGFFITNGTYAYYDMKEGSAFTKKFGGTSGNDPDFFKVSINAWKNNGNRADTSLDVYLADFRFSDNANDYILNTWKFVDLNAFGAVDSFSFNFYSSDTGQFGINTPLYFCIDNFGSHTIGIEKANNNFGIRMYPNPAQNTLHIACNEKIEAIEIFNLNGVRVLQSEDTNLTIDALIPGIYIVHVQHAFGISQQKLIKQ
ncbi:MAG: DUF4465 domain-containing protein [Sphingobacteriales bacterium]|nr:DUF4465 domain-containing protein [Sphingobacteriales bacterium]